MLDRIDEALQRVDAVPARRKIARDALGDAVAT
jgi:hypothetical protein